MASKPSAAVVELHRRWLTVPAADPDWIPHDNRLLMHEWDVLTTASGVVDYVEVDAAGSIYAHREVFAHLAKAVGARVLLVDYRQLPDGVYPASVRDVVTADDWLLGQGTASEADNAIARLADWLRPKLAA